MKGINDPLDIDRLNNISEDFHEAAHTTFNEGVYDINQQESSSTSSSQRGFDVIQNLEEKLKILTDSDVRPTGRKDTARRNTANRRRGATTKKRFTEVVMDENTLLEDIRGINVSMLQSINESRSFIENAETTELYKEFFPRIFQKN